MRTRGLDQFCRWWVIVGAHETYAPVLDHRFDAVGVERRQNVERRVHRSITVAPGVLLAPECGVLFASVSSAPSDVNTAHHMKYYVSCLFLHSDLHVSCREVPHKKHEQCPRLLRKHLQ